MSTATANQQPPLGEPNRLDDVREHYIREHPAPAGFVTFALGFGTGLALVALVAGEQKKQIPEGLAQRLGQQVLDSLAHVLPDSVADRLHY